MKLIGFFSNQFTAPNMMNQVGPMSGNVGNPQMQGQVQNNPQQQVSKY